MNSIRKKVYQYDSDYNLTNVFNSLRECENSIGKSVRTIYRHIINGKIYFGYYY